MRFLLDANMPRSAASLLRELSHEVEDVRDVLPNGADDATVAAYAIARQLTLITRDFDFADIRNYPPKDYAGIHCARTSRRRCCRAGEPGLAVICEQAGPSGTIDRTAGHRGILARPFPPT